MLQRHLAILLSAGCISSSGCARILGLEDITVVDANPDTTIDSPKKMPDYGLTAASIPLRIAVGETASITMVIAGPPSSTFPWSVTSGGGTFHPTSGIVATTSGGIGTIVTDYTAPSGPGDRAHTLSLPTSIEAAFETRVRALEVVGEPIPYPDNAGISVPAAYLYGQQIYLSRDGVVMQLGLHAQVGGGTGRLALYTNAGGVPGTLVVGSSLTAMVVGPNDFRVTPTAVSAGTYWILGNFSAVASIKRNANSNVGLAFTVLDTADALPNVLVGTMSTTNRVLNYYVRFAD